MTWYSGLDPKIHDDLKSFDKPCVAACELLKKKYPEQLISLVESGKLEASLLTVVAEMLGDLDSSFSDKVRKALIPLLSDSSPVVREGAIYGLQGTHSNSVVRFKLLDMASKDTSKGIREICSRIINNIGVVKAF